jgi:glycosyltransferase involved in cell wall biosynthesis
MDLYDRMGRRRIGPTLRFGYGVLKHLLRNRHKYRIVHVANFPFFSLLAVRLALIGSRTNVFVDWHEVWTKNYWRSYAGRLLGTLGYAIQQICVRLTPRAYVFSEQNAKLLLEAGLSSAPIVLAGLLPTQHNGVANGSESSRPPTVLFAGRHIEEKGVDLVPEAFFHARATISDLRLVIAGDGPLRRAVESRVVALGIQDAVRFTGFLNDEEFSHTMAKAACLLLPSRREGYGMIVAEATALGTPVVVAAHPQNSALHLVQDGINGIVVTEPSAESLAKGVIRAVQVGPELRRSAAAWSRDHYSTMTMDRSVERILADYAESEEPAVGR